MNASSDILQASPLIVLGMHRGGTSAFAGLLHRLGYDLGPTVMQPVDGVNTTGFWEHLGAFRINEQLYSALGRSRFDPREMPQNWQSLPAFRSAVSDARGLIERDFSPTRPWAMKDPRFCRTLPIWLEAMEQLGYRPRAVLVARDPRDVARSLQAQKWVDSPARSNLCWLQHMLEAERYTRGIPRAIVGYDAIVDHWRTAVKTVFDTLEIDWPEGDSANHADVDAFIDQQQRHFGSDAANATDQPTLPSLVNNLWTSLSHGRAESWSDIARISAAYSEGAEVFGPCLDEAIVEATLAHFENDRREAASRVELHVDASEGPAQQTWPAGSAPMDRRRPSGIVDVHTSLTELRDRLSEIIDASKRVDDTDHSDGSASERTDPSGD